MSPLVPQPASATKCSSCSEYLVGPVPDTGFVWIYIDRTQEQK
jgi:hypothetical protein